MGGAKWGRDSNALKEESMAGGTRNGSTLKPARKEPMSKVEFWVLVLSWVISTDVVESAGVLGGGDMSEETAG